jgi:hypothetical protein
MESQKLLRRRAEMVYERLGTGQRIVSLSGFQPGSCRRINFIETDRAEMILEMQEANDIEQCACILLKAFVRNPSLANVLQKPLSFFH